MILESIVTTKNDDGSAKISPMGPLIDEEFKHFTLRPFQTSRTFQNLRRHGEGVMHVTDDVELFARAAVNQLAPPPRLIPAEHVDGFVLGDACRWYAFRVTQLDDSQERAEIQCEVVATGRIRDFYGFNRAKHAVVEAAILATRVEFLPADQIRHEMERLRSPVVKTAGPSEQRAFDFLCEYIGKALGDDT